MQRCALYEKPSLLLHLQNPDKSICMCHAMPWTSGCIMEDNSEAALPNEAKI